MSWSASQYSKFEAERNRPIVDLLAQVKTVGVRTAADIGCGPGNSTELLQSRFPEAVVTGMDSSANMIEAARKRLPGVRFELDDISIWSDPGPFDVILANAALQWVPNHDSLLPALLSKLTNGGILAVQTPDNLAEPAHLLMREVAADGPWSEKLAGVSSGLPARHSPEWYHSALSKVASTVDVWRTTYYHSLSGGPSAVVEWFKGTGLRPFIDPLEESEKEEFLAKYEDAISVAYPSCPGGSVLLPFPRLFFVATR